MLDTKTRRVPELHLPTALYEAVQAAGMFGFDHKRVIDCIEHLFEVIGRVQEKNEGDAVLAVHDDDFICAGARFPVRGRELVLLKEKLESARITCMRFSEGLNVEELGALIRILLRHTEAEVLRDVPHELAQAGVRHLSCGERNVSREILKASPIGSTTSLWRRVRHLDAALYKELLDTMKGMRARVLNREIPNAYRVKTAIESLVLAMLMSPDDLVALVFRPQEDDWILAHAVRSCILALRLGVELTDDETSLHLLAESMLMNDIGLFTVPPSVLYKRGSLTESEQEMIEHHPIEGAAMLLTGVGFAPATVEAALLHHAGPRGYPPIDKATTPSVMCKIVRIVDAYECMVGGRPYRAPRPPLEAAAELLRGAGTVFDAALVGRFIRTLGLAPVGSLVVLSNGAVGEVIGHERDDLLRPSVVIFIDENGLTVEGGAPVALTRAEDLTITATLPLDATVDYSYVCATA